MKYITAFVIACLLTVPAFAAKEVKMEEIEFEEELAPTLIAINITKGDEILAGMTPFL